MERFDAIFKKYHQPLLLYSLKFIDNEGDASDVVQEVFIIVWEKGKYKLKDEHLKSFLFNSIKNSCLNYLKHKLVMERHINFQKQNLTEFELYHYKNGEKSLIENEDLDKIYSAINTLSENYKEVLALSRFEGMKNIQIAEKLNIPIRTVETRLYRALSELKKTLSENSYLFN